MNYLRKMYGRRSKNTPQSIDKNPNRVAGGLRAQGVDTFVVVSEDGSEQHIPTQKYVQSLEEQIRTQREKLNVLERRLVRLTTETETLRNFIQKNKG